MESDLELFEGDSNVGGDKDLSEYMSYYKPGRGFSKDFSKVMTILANEVIISGPIGPRIISWPYRAS